MNKELLNYLRTLPQIGGEIYNAHIHPHWEVRTIKQEKGLKAKNVAVKYQFLDGRCVYFVTNDKGETMHPPTYEKFAINIINISPELYRKQKVETSNRFTYSLTIILAIIVVATLFTTHRVLTKEKPTLNNLENTSLLQSQGNKCQFSSSQTIRVWTNDIDSLKFELFIDTKSLKGELNIIDNLKNKRIKEYEDMAIRFITQNGIYNLGKYNARAGSEQQFTLALAHRHIVKDNIGISKSTHNTVSQSSITQQSSEILTSKAYVASFVNISLEELKSGKLNHKQQELIDFYQSNTLQNLYLWQYRKCSTHIDDFYSACKATLSIIGEQNKNSFASREIKIHPIFK